MRCTLELVLSMGINFRGMFLLHCVVLYHRLLFYAILRCALINYVMQWHALLSYVMFYRAILCYTPCYVMLCYIEINGSPFLSQSEGRLFLMQ